MVNSNLAYKFQEVEHEIDYSYLPDQLKYTSISLTEVYNNKLRLEANSFNLEAKAAKEKILGNQFGAINLWSDIGLIGIAFHKPRFKRIYVDRIEIPFFQPSSIKFFWTPHAPVKACSEKKKPLPVTGLLKNQQSFPTSRKILF